MFTEKDGMQKFQIVFPIILAGLGLLGFYFFMPKKSDSKGHQPIKLDRAYDKKNIVPVLIIGSGCAGYASAIYGARANVYTLVVAGNEPGGQLSGTTQVDNWPGLLHEMGPEIIEKVKNQAEHFGAFVINDAVKDVDLSSWPYQIFTQDGHTIHALSVVIATGATPKLLSVPGEKEYWGGGVTTCAICDAPFHKDSDVVVIGGGDSAAEEALQLAPYAKTVTLLVRKDYMRASSAMQERLKEIPSISVRYNTEVKEIIGDGKEVTSVKLLNNTTNEVSHKSVTGVFLAVGHEPNTEIFRKYLETDANGYLIPKGRTQETDLPGVFAAGDVEDHRYRQAGVAAGSGIKAALDATGFLRDIGFNEAVAHKLESNYFRLVEKSPLAQLNQIKSIDEFYELMEVNDKVVVVDFYTRYCPSCLQMLPLVEEMAYELRDKVVVVKADAGELEELADALDISTVPALVAFKKGHEMLRSNDAMNKEQLMEFFAKVI